eukprot:8442593-Alexandrium_andersonii.AAC.1
MSNAPAGGTPICGRLAAADVARGVRKLRRPTPGPHLESPRPRTTLAPGLRPPGSPRGSLAD